MFRSDDETLARHGVHALNFFVAAIQTGFGPFVTVWLASLGWSLTDIGLALSIGTIASLVGQLPGGMLVDAVHRKRDVTAAALAALALSALIIAAAPSVAAIWAAEVLHAFASVIIAPAIAALTLTLFGHDSFSERLGGNARYASFGSALAAAAFGYASTLLGDRSLFVIAAALGVPAALSLVLIKPDACQPADTGHMMTVPMKEREHPAWTIFRDPLLHVFGLCVVLFHLCNAALLPLALGGLSQRGEASGFVVSAAIIVPQLVTAVFSPWVGGLAQRIGRRPVLLAGFAALPLRALLFATSPGPVPLEMMQVLDGVSGTVFGLMLPLIAADLTRRNGYLNLAMGAFGLAAGLGATFSTSVAGWAADMLGQQMAFLGLAGVGGAAVALVFLAMPETRPAVTAGGSPVSEGGDAEFRASM